MAESEKSIEEIREEVESSGMSRDELLGEIKESIREVRLALPNYRAIQEPRRYQLTLSDVEDAELMYSQYINDAANIFELEDLQETLMVIRLKRQTVYSIMDRFNRGEWQTPTD